MLTQRIDFKDTGRIVTELTNSGIVLVNGLGNIDEFAGLSQKLGVVIKHRDSNHPSGVITLRPTEGVERETFKGYTRKEQYLHTDGTMVTHPADIVALMCEKQSGVGGESIFVDVLKLYTQLEQQDPELLNELFAEDAATFGEEADGLFKKPILKRVGEGLVSVSFRYDKLVTFSDAIQKKLESLLGHMDAAMQTIKLEPREGYIINNHRFIHGRRSFEGDRIIHRAQIHAFADGLMPLGFSVNP